MFGPVIGIDLGTTNSALAIIREGRPEVVSMEGEGLLPSVVGLSPEGSLLVGRTARNQWGFAPERTVRSIKRRMGSGQPVSMAGREYTPQEISAFILREMRERAEAFLKEPVRRAVITVPAYFNEIQRQATLEAGQIADLQVERVLNEPTAAALAYGDGPGECEALRVMVYDLGGGTFDVSIIELNHGVVDVLATAGDNHLGGDDFDELMATRLAEEFEEEHDVDLRQDHQAWARLLGASEEAKIHLSDHPVTLVALDYVATGRNGDPLHLQRELGRPEFEDLISGLLAPTGDKIRQALDDAKLGAGDIDRVLLVGGSTRIPMVWELVADLMGQEPHEEVDPDTAVALGAAVQAGIIAGEPVDAILVDVTPLSLGIETARIGWSGRVSPGHFSPLVRRNTTIPVRKSERFTTIRPGQDEIHVKVYQGESAFASENTLIGDFRVEDLVPGKEDGLADVLIGFSLDVNGILDVTVTEESTRKQTHARLQATRQRLSPEEIARSRQKVARAEEDLAEETAATDPGTATLVERARRALSDPDLSGGTAHELREILQRIGQASGAGREAEVAEWCDRLIDVLLDLEA